MLIQNYLKSHLRADIQLMITKYTPSIFADRYYYYLFMIVLKAVCFKLLHSSQTRP